MNKKIVALLSLLEIISLLSLINQSTPIEPFVIIIAASLAILDGYFKLINSPKLCKLMYILLFMSIPVRLYCIFYNNHILDLIYANFICLAFLGVYITEAKKMVYKEKVK